MPIRYLPLLIIFHLCSYHQGPGQQQTKPASTIFRGPTLIILGNVQDAGSPHIACQKECCRLLFNHPDPVRKVVSLGLVDPENNRKYLFEATPDIAEQAKLLKTYLPDNDKEIPDAIFLTHAHIGHYTGLMYLGKEAMNASQVSVYAMPNMSAFLTNNGPWNQLVIQKNITVNQLVNGKQISLTSNLKVVPFLVPHRDEFSETAGFKIIGPAKSALFIPDIDKWSKWEKDIIEQIQQVNYAFIDATFFNADEVDHRDITEIPHPLVTETMDLLSRLPVEDKRKIWFIHLNHTNPMLNPQSEPAKLVLSRGFNIARFNDEFEL